MHRLALLILITSGCTLYFETGDDQPPPTCSTPFTTVNLVDPATLQCETFSEPGPCPPGCSCPVINGVNGSRIAAQPTWGSCDSSCEKLDEASCLASDSNCRVARDWARYYENDPNSFIGCFPLDQIQDVGDPVACEGRDAESCTRGSFCTALYQAIPNDCAGCADEQFQECIPTGQKAGVCNGPTACDIASPPCPTGTEPGTDGVCYTGACIPEQFCGQL